MRAASLIVIADRGSLKAYRVEERARGRLGLMMVQGFEIPNMNDMSRTRHTTAVTDWPQLELEERRRLCRQLAEEITKLVTKTAGEGWSLAAPKSIYKEMIDLLPLEIRQRIVEHVHADLTKIPVADLPEHFRSLQPL